MLISRSCGGAKSEGTGRGAAYKKELRFDPLATSIPLNRPDYRALDLNSETGYRNNSSYNHISNDDDDDQRNIQPQVYTYDYISSESTNTDSEDGVGDPQSPSPSPSPRTGSAMSMISMSRRSGTPTTSTMLMMSGSAHNLTTTGTPSSHWGNNSGYLNIPSARQGR